MSNTNINLLHKYILIYIRLPKVALNHGTIIRTAVRIIVPCLNLSVLLYKKVMKYLEEIRKILHLHVYLCQHHCFSLQFQQLFLSHFFDFQF